MEQETKKGLGQGRWIALVAIALAAFGGAFWLLKPAASPPPATTAAATAPPAPQDTALPAPGESDARIRELLGRVSQRPLFARWLTASNLLDVWVVTTDNLAEDVSPRKPLAFLAPEGAFSVRRKGRKTVIDERSYRRYDAVADTIASVDTQAFAAAVRTLHPLLEAAYHALGYPDRSIDGAAAQALSRISGAPIAEGEVEVQRTGGPLWLFADDNLERKGAVEKHLLRMGPRNTRLIQAKAREVASVLGLPSASAAAQAPTPSR